MNTGARIIMEPVYLDYCKRKGRRAADLVARAVAKAKRRPMARPPMVTTKKEKQPRP